MQYNLNHFILLYGQNMQYSGVTVTCFEFHNIRSVLFKLNKQLWASNVKKKLQWFICIFHSNNVILYNCIFNKIDYYLVNNLLFVFIFHNIHIVCKSK